MSNPSRQQKNSDILILEDFLPYRLSILANRVSRAIAERYAREFDLTIPEWRVIAVLGQRPGLSSKEIAAVTDMDKVAISRATARLSSAGRVVARSDRSDKRLQSLFLTAAGSRLHARITPMALACEAQLLAALTSGQKVALDELLDHLIDAAGTL